MKTLINIAGWISRNRQWMLLLLILVCLPFSGKISLEIVWAGIMLLLLTGEAYAIYSARELKKHVTIYVLRKRNWLLHILFIASYAYLLVLHWQGWQRMSTILMLIAFFVFGIIQMFRFRDNLYFIAFEDDTIHVVTGDVFSVSTSGIRDIRFGKDWYRFKWSPINSFTISLNDIRSDQREAFRLALEEWVMKHEFAAEKK